MTAPRDTEAGFTLIETLVALTVLATGAVALLVAVERHTANTRGLADRVVARWVGENALSAETLNLPMAPEWRNAFGIDWQVTVTARPLSASGLDAVVVEVGETTPVVALTGYLARGTAQP